MNIDLIPNGAIKRVHVSQNDVGRTLMFELFNNSTLYTVPSGATVKIQGTKPNGLGFSETCTVNNNLVTVDTTEAMTEVSGNIPTELSIAYNDVVLGTSNFVLAVEKNPHPEGTVDGTGDNPVIENLEVIITNAVDAWLDEHPEATTTVVDGSLTEAKFSEALKLETIKDYVTPEMFGAKGDGVTNDTQAIQDAIDSISSTGGCVQFGSKTYVVDSIKVSTNNIVLKGFKSSYHGTGTVLIASSTNTGPMIDVSVASGMKVGGGIFDIALMANNSRQNYDTAIAKIGINILNRAEFVLENVYISGFKNGGVYAKDWWDSNVIGLEIRACGIADTNGALYLGSDDDSCNSIHFFGLHIEECPYQMHIDGLNSHIQFVASKFEGGASYGEPNVGTRFIYIYEGVYAVTFDSCFFSDNAETVWVEVRNNFTTFVGCQFAGVKGTIIKNYSTNTSYGNGVVINSCQFEDFGRYSTQPIYLKNNAIISDCRFNCSNLVYPIYVAGNHNLIANNMFKSTVNLTNPLINFASDSNHLKGNVYSGCKELWTGNDGNYVDNICGWFEIVTSISIDFKKSQIRHPLYNGSSAITVTNSNIKNMYADAEVVIASNGQTITLDSSIVVGGTQVQGGKAVHLKYVKGLSKFVVV